MLVAGSGATGALVSRLETLGYQVVSSVPIWRQIVKLTLSCRRDSDAVALYRRGQREYTLEIEDRTGRAPVVEQLIRSVRRALLPHSKVCTLLGRPADWSVHCDPSGEGIDLLGFFVQRLLSG